MNAQSIKNNKWVRRAAWTVVGVLVLWAVAWLAVPPILKSQGQRIASEQLGRKVTIGGVDFKPWTLALTISDLAVATADGAGQQLHIRRLYIEGALQSILRLAPVVDAITVDAPSLKLTHLGDGHYDIDDILARLNQPSGKPPGKPLHFALYNLALNGGSVDFTDKTVNKTHQLRDLTLSVPFLSNLDSKRDVVVSPRLAFRLNGSRFDSAAQGTPFAQTRKTDATIRLAGFDLAPYLGYIPASLPLQLQAGVIDADMKVAFEQSPKMSVKLSGTVQASGVKLTDAKSQDLLAFDSLKLTLADVRPLDQMAKISGVELTGPRVAVRRDAAGRLNLDLAATPAAAASTPDATKNGAKGEDAKTAVATKDAQANAWKIDVAKVAVRGGAVAWTDETTAPHAQLALRDLVLDASGIALPFAQPLQFSGSAALGTGAISTVPPAATAAASTAATPAAAVAATGAHATPTASLSFSGSATDRSATAVVTVGALPLAVAAPYLASFIEPSLNGQLAAELGVTWRAAVDGAAGTSAQSAALQLTAKQLTLENLALTGGKAMNPPARQRPARVSGKVSGRTSARTTGGVLADTSLASIKKIEVADAQVDLDQQSIKVGKLMVTEPHAKVQRGADKRWMFEHWLKQPTSPAPPKVSASKKPQAQTRPWMIALNDVAVDGGTVSYLDQATPTPVAFDVSALKVHLTNFSPDGKKPSPLTVSARVAAGRTEPGRLDYRGNLALNPLSAQGQLQAVRLPLHAFAPYFADALNVHLLRADASFKGQVHYADSKGGPVVKVTGDTALEDFRADSVPLPGTPAVAPDMPAAATGKATNATATATSSGIGATQAGEELLQWKALSVRGLDLAMRPGAATTFNVRETALSDFFARVIIDPSGRINIQDLVKSSAPPAASALKATGIAMNSVASQVEPTKAGASTATATAADTTAKGPAPVIHVGPISLINGKVFFSDHFIKPNYSADLTELTGKLSAFSSVAPAGVPEMADLELRGRAEGSASLEITGKLNPLAKPLALDITGKVRDLELPPLSPYAIKYAGHGIERGKMSLDVNYVVLPNGQLTAKNNLVLNQLTFGEEVQGAPASLPVKLAVALLADRNGVINLDLPISGSLNDPQFSLGPIIVKVILNVIVKAITAPFSLLANAFGGGGDELSSVAFAPGSAELTPEARQNLGKVAKALAERPALKMTVVGTASLDAEREGYRRERLQAMVRAEKRREGVVGGSATAPAPAASAAAGQDAGTTTATPVTTVSEAEYPALLKQVYKHADVPKPRNLIGMAKDIPQPEMESLLMATIPVTQDAMSALALARAIAVKDYLASKQVPAQQLFLGAPKAAADQPASAGKPGAKWSPQAELNLATQ